MTETSALQAAAIYFSSTFDLPDRVKWLNMQCLDAAERQERASKARKQLTEDTRETKRTAAASQDPSFIVDSYNKLLKVYQSEIDALTKRAKSAESALVDTYRVLEQAPNPGLLLQQAVSMEQTISKQKFENAKLQTELKEFEAEFSELKNQDITIRQLEDRIQDLEAELDAKAKVEEIASEMVKERMEEDEDAKREIEELKLTLERVEREAAEQRKAADAARTELYEVKAQFEERDASRQTEIDLLQEELTSIKQASQSESEILRLRKLGIEEEERERKRREEELSRLYAALDAARVEASRAREAEADAHRKREKEIEEMRVRGEERLQREKERVAELERLLNESTSVADVSLRREQDDEAVEQERLKLSQSLETVIAQLRVALNEKESMVDKYKNELLKLEERIGDQNELIQKLQHESIMSGSASPAAFATSPTGEGSASNEGNANMIGIYQELRDRFRKRILELEQELSAVAGKEKRSRELLEKTRSENAALAERVRVLRTTQRGEFPGAFGTVGPAAAGGRSPLQLILRFISANPLARTLLLVYVGALHLLVLASLSSSTSNDQDIKTASLRKND